jgi:hypothetical protein
MSELTACSKEAKAVVEFENRIKYMIIMSNGYHDRLSAIRWIAKREGAVQNSESLCLLLGLPRDYFVGDFF